MEWILFLLIYHIPNSITLEINTAVQANVFLLIYYLALNAQEKVKERRYMKTISNLCSKLVLLLSNLFGLLHTVS